jgi:uncharacterized membrane protein YtjA (UPF0391 family)
VAWRGSLIYWALIFLIIAVIAGLLELSGLSFVAYNAVLLVVATFDVLFVITFIAAWPRRHQSVNSHTVSYLFSLKDTFCLIGLLTQQVCLVPLASEHNASKKSGKELSEDPLELTYLISCADNGEKRIFGDNVMGVWVRDGCPTRSDGNDGAPGT